MQIYQVFSRFTISVGVTNDKRRLGARIRHFICGHTSQNVLYILEPVSNKLKFA